MYKMEKKIELRLLEFGHDGKYAVKWKCLPSLFKVPYNDEENLFLDYVSGFNYLWISCDLVFTPVHLHYQRINLLLKPLKNPNPWTSIPPPPKKRP
uniref:Uncharacterized protein n=1 Tax=Lepeophtheirus salmonis TaxID=72036 RepID=A0A0K2TFR2_LEPSM